jgi:hypothetical protein
MNDKNTKANKRLAKVAVQCSADTFVVNQSLVLRINICGENRHLCQDRNRYRFQFVCLGMTTLGMVQFATIQKPMCKLPKN